MRKVENAECRKCGESRSTLLQTASIIHARTTNIDRGAMPYIAADDSTRGKIELHSGLSPHSCYPVALPTIFEKCCGCDATFAVKFRHPPRNILVKQVDRQVVVSAQTLPTTYYRPNPTYIRRKNPAFCVLIELDIY